MFNQLKLRPLEREDLPFVHRLNNDAKIMSYWFEEPYETFVELQDLFDKHIHDQSERRFIIEKETEMIGLVELVEIDYIHRRAEFQIIIDPEHQGNGYSSSATYLAMNYAFSVLNLHKLYLIVDEDNAKAIHLYKKAGFTIESELQDEFFVDGYYRNAIRMCIFQDEFLSLKKSKKEGMQG
ncbi:spermidine N1-acetyltransferase [Bacillus paralicheniformis]|jgi:diamine N-acetyltransferase|uniref:Spermidine N(1)-acetyltransferase n=1 Tax=Bacillus paralicheniformis TaxID=1648923 RepID=A0A6I7U308_9BACI|nr:MULTISPECIES: spermidine N1-acetyltransferase [Bacillus]ETB69253.1 spermidine N1-acetyltransferase [Bacillus sp. CPSM8]KUL07677.1 spermidine N1-acetyltransferase [Bacillus licheniformis LMG 7559]KUL15184.1 spermidine N1-acetyltransferase [Bacillus licheniformis LMG 6934]MBC8624691.1 spermidine N1-acetyltransferase [Robertmurraya crescens]POO77145.1 GNAT family N-acetyltransferase [Bacillus sp. MBGLi97]